MIIRRAILLVSSLVASSVSLQVSPSSAEAWPHVDVVQVSVGSYNACAVSADGQVLCWGSNSSGQSDVPADLATATQVATGLSHTCALLVTKQVRCWGANGSGQTNVPGDLGLVLQVSVGAYGSCALLVAGGVRCWGASGDGQLVIPDVLASGAAQVSRGFGHACGVSATSKAVCWGFNSDGQASTPSNLAEVTQVSAGWLHSCAVTKARSIVCWGRNSEGQGNPPADIGPAAQVAAGAYGTCSVGLDNSVRCWGQVPSPSDAFAATSVGAGYSYACALTTSKTVYCWGDNRYGQATPPIQISPAPAPAAPEQVTASPLDGGISVAWSAPADPYNLITGYVAKASPGDGSCTTTLLSCTITGLTNGIEYTVTVSSVGSTGTSPSAGLAKVRPFGKPSPPQNLLVNPSSNRLTLSWDAPSSDGGSPIAWYEYSVDGGLTFISTGSTATSLVLTDLIKGSRYAVTVRAHNVAGSGLSSNLVSAIPADAPGAVRDVRASAGNSQITVSWSPPSDDGGSAVTGYVARVDDIHTCTTSGLSCVISGLQNGQSYGVSVLAQNAAGTGPATPFGRGVVPFTTPSAPFGVRAIPGDSSAVVLVQGGDSGGLPVSRFTYVAAPGGARCTSSSGNSMCTIVGLTNGTSYTFTATMTTAAGTSPASLPSRSVTVGLGGLSSISTGQYGDCGVRRAGQLVCWGMNADLAALNDSAPVFANTVTQVSTYSYHACALDSAGSLQCWGDNQSGAAAVPPSLGKVKQVSTSEQVTCALKDSSAVVCWGDDYWGGQDVPEDLPPVSQISVGERHTCAVTTSGRVVCWGDYVWSQADVPSDLTDVSQVSVGVLHACALTRSGQVTCWGSNSQGQTNAPKNLGVVREISVGGWHTCALLQAGTVTCWGFNDEGQSAVPSSLGPVTQISAGYRRTCALQSNGRAVCWGYPHTPFQPLQVVEPTQPTTVSTQASQKAISVMWSAPTDDGGAAITGYLVSASPGGASCATAGTTSCTLAGLNPGVAYKVFVIAMSSAGVSAPAAVTAATLPATTPGAPTAVAITTTSSTATVSWIAPSSDGGSPLTGYTAIATPGNFSCSTNSVTHCVITGLTPGVTYRFSVVALNAEGASGASTPVSSATPATVSDAPNGVSVTAASASASVSWAPPAFNGGASITGYTATASPGGASCTATFGVNACRISGLANGTTYSITVVASNAVGASAPSTAVTVTPSAAPAAPTSVKTTAGNGAITITWTASSTAYGQSTPTGYVATATPGGANCSTTTTSCTISGLANGIAYSITVVAVSAYGTSRASLAATATPLATTPSAPTNVVANAGATSATVTWSAPASDGGSPITGYTVTASQSGLACTSSGATSCTVNGISPGFTYTFTVIATNGIGASVSSTPSNAVICASNVFTLAFTAPLVAAGAPATIRVFNAPANTAIMLTGAIKATVVTDNTGIATLQFTTGKAGALKVTATYTIPGKRPTKVSAAAQTYASAVTASATAMKINKPAKFTASATPPNSLVQLMLSDGKSLISAADSSGKATFTTVLSAPGTVTWTAYVAGIQVAAGAITISK